MPEPKSASNKQTEPLPAALLEQLDTFKKELWRRKTREAFLAGVGGLMISFCLVLVLDRFISSPGWFRLLILVAGASISAIFCPYWIRRWIYGHRNDAQLARLIAKRFPHLGDRLLGAIELHSDHSSGKNDSPELRAAALRVVTRDAAQKDLSIALPKKREKPLLIAGLIAAFCIITAFVISPRAGVTSLKRWAMPLSQTERFTFTRIQPIDRTHLVPFGEPFEFRIQLSPSTQQRPQHAQAKLGKTQTRMTSLQNDSYLFKFDPIQQKRVLQLSLGDAKHRISIIPTLRPSLENIQAHIQSPSYLSEESVTIDLKSGVLSALVGSQIKIEAEVSRPLSKATMNLLTQKGEAPTSTNLPLTISSEKIMGHSFTAQETPGELPVQWVDHLGIESKKPFQIRYRPVIDQAPLTYIQGVQREIIILPEETIRLELNAEDDFGLLEFGVSWKGQHTRPTDEASALGEVAFNDLSIGKKKHQKTFEFSPSAFGISPQKVILHAFAKDQYPGRARILSTPITIYVLTRDEHSALLKDKFDQLIENLEESLRREQQLHDQNERLRELSGKQLQQEKKRELLYEQEISEAQSVETLQKMHTEMAEIFQNALRNGDIDKDTMKTMSQLLQKLKELAEEDLPAVKKFLEKTQQSRLTPEQAKKELTSATTLQKEALEKMREALNEANDASDSFEEGTFISRLKRASREEENIARTLIKNITEIVGLNVSELDPKHLRMMNELSEQQKRTANNLYWIRDDLIHFQERAPKEVYEKLINIMTTSQAELELEYVYQKLNSNLTYVSISEAKKWSGIIAQWAKLLEDEKKKEQSQSNGEGQQGESPEDEDFEFMLKVMQMVQKQQDIRARTRALEKLRREQSEQNFLTPPPQPLENKAPPQQEREIL